MPNPIARIEITSRQPEQMNAFLNAVFGWTGRTEPVAGVSMTELSGSGVAAHVLEWPHEVPTYIAFYVQVDDVQAHLERAVSAGATVIVPTTDAPTGATIAMFLTPEGHPIGLIRPSRSF